MHKAEIIQRIKNGDETQLLSIYKEYRDEFVKFASYNYALSNEDAKDVFQNAVIALYENVQSGKLSELTSDIKTYLFAIGKFQMLNLKKKTSLVSNLSSDYAIKENPFDMAEDDETRNEMDKLVKSVIRDLPEVDQKILELYYYEDKSLRDIAQMLNYKNENVVKKKKSLIMKKIGEQVLKISKGLMSIIL